jgi:hypothetical protein
LSLNENTINQPSLPGDANYNKNPTWFPSSSPPPRGCSGTASSVKAAQAKFVQSGGGDYYQYTGDALGLISGNMTHGEMKRYNNTDFIKRSTNDYANIFPHKMLMGGKRHKSRKQIGCMSMYGGKRSSTKKSKRSSTKKSKRSSTKKSKRSSTKRSMKKRSMKKRSMKKSKKSKKSKKGKKSKSRKIRRYRGGNIDVMPTFINEFNTTLSPDESGMASPTPLTRTPGDCTYIKY